MDKNNILQFEADDTSKTGINGKQVFLTKRINGKISRNKDVDEESRYIPQHEEDLFIEFKNVKVNPKNIPQKKDTPKTNNTKKYINKNQKKKKKKANVISKIIIVLLIIIGIIIFAFISPIFNIKTIEINGNDKIDSSTIESLSGITKGRNIFKVSKKRVIDSIKENQYINKVTINRNLPSTLQIDVEERKVSYQIKVINSYVYIDYQGFILEISSIKENVPLVEGLTTEQDILLNGKRLANKDIEELRVILKIMENAKTAEIDNLISKITIKNNDYILELSKENKLVYLGDATNLTNRMSYIKIILNMEKKKTGKIFVNGDINNGFKPYFREEKN